MSYTINRFNGDQIAVVPDGTINTVTDITLIGKNYAGYGEKQNENFVYLLDNFSKTSPPTKPLDGQLWYNATTGVLKINVYDGTNWKSLAVTNVTTSTNQTTPSTVTTGDMWYDQVTDQLKIFNGTSYTLVGPESVFGYGQTQMHSVKVKDTVNNYHAVQFGYSNGNIIFAVSNDANFNPSVAISGFPTIYQGITVNSSMKYHGTATNADQLGTNLPAFYAPISNPEFPTVVKIVDAGLSIGSTLSIFNSVTNIPTIKNITGSNMSFQTTTGSVTNTPLTLLNNNILPGTNSTTDLGSSVLAFKNLYAGYVYSTAQKADSLSLGGTYVTATTASASNTIVARDVNADIRGRKFIGKADSAIDADHATQADRADLASLANVASFVEWYNVNGKPTNFVFNDNNTTAWNINIAGASVGTHTGPVVGNVTGNLSGNTSGQHVGAVLGNVTGDVTGNTFGIHTGNVNGNVTGNTAGTHTGPVVGNLTGNTAGTHTGPVVGNLTGNVVGNMAGNATGAIHTATNYFAGNLIGNVTGNVSGSTAGFHTGNVSGNVVGNVVGNVTGNVTGNVAGNVAGNATGTIHTATNYFAGNLIGNVTGNVVGNVTGNVIGNVTGAVTGNSTTATRLATPRTINNTSFDGTSNISFSTAQVAEGSNLYYTDSRARSAISVSGGLSYNPSTGVINGPVLSAVATSGSYNSLSDKPSIPTAVNIGGLTNNLNNIVKTIVGNISMYMTAGSGSGYTSGYIDATVVPGYGGWSSSTFYNRTDVQLNYGPFNTGIASITIDLGAFLGLSNNPADLTWRGNYDLNVAASLNRINDTRTQYYGLAPQQWSVFVFPLAYERNDARYGQFTIQMAIVGADHWYHGTTITANWIGIGSRTNNVYNP